MVVTRRAAAKENQGDTVPLVHKGNIKKPKTEPSRAEIAIQTVQSEIKEFTILASCRPLDDKKVEVITPSCDQATQTEDLLIESTKRVQELLQANRKLLDIVNKQWKDFLEVAQENTYLKRAHGGLVRFS